MGQVAGGGVVGQVTIEREEDVGATKTFFAKHELSADTAVDASTASICPP